MGTRYCDEAHQHFHFNDEWLGVMESKILNLGCTFPVSYDLTFPYT